MADELTTLLEKYLTEKDPQIRMNALRAHAVFGRKQNIDALVQVALKDKEPAVCLRAEEELAARIGTQAQTIVRESLQDCLKDPDQKQEAYLLAGRLRGRGFPIRSSGLPWTERLALSFSMGRLLYPVRDRRFRLRAFGPALIGTLIGSLFGFGPALTGMDTLSEFTSMLAALTLVLLALVLLASQFMVPFPMRIDRRAGLLVELAYAVLWGTLFFIFSIIFRAFAGGSFDLGNSCYAARQTPLKTAQNRCS